MSAHNADTRDVDLDLAYWAWTLLANVSEGDWSQQTTEWQQAVVRWRDAFHEALDDYGQCGDRDASRAYASARSSADSARSRSSRSSLSQTCSRRARECCARPIW
jgi:hypothetical protein